MFSHSPRVLIRHNYIVPTCIRFVEETQRAIRLLLVVDLFTLTITLVCAGVQLSHVRTIRNALIQFTINPTDFN